MNYSKAKEFLDRGYTWLNEEESIEYNLEDIEVYDLDKEYLKSVFVFDEYFPYADFESSAVFVKYYGTLDLCIDDIKLLLNNIISKEIEQVTFHKMIEIISANGDKENLIHGLINYYPSKNDTDDYFFESDESIIAYVVYVLNSCLVEDYYNKASEMKDAIDSLITNRCKALENKKYNMQALHMVFDRLSNYIVKADASFDLCMWYKETLLSAVNEDDLDASIFYAYECYEGGKVFDANHKKALELFLNAFKRKQDPFIANTLGYIYYYGKANNNIPNYVLAFQYFNFAHFTYGILESTYKLADCYMNGYGCIKSYKASYNLVRSIYSCTLDALMNGEKKSKYADVCIRLGNMYKNGYYVKKDKDEAYECYLLSKAALFYRLLDYTYIGDKSLCKSVYYSIKELKEDVNREISNNSYVVEFNGILGESTIKINNDNTLDLFEKPENVVEIKVFPKIGLSEVNSEAHYIFTGVDTSECDTSVYTNVFVFCDENKLKFEIGHKQIEISFDKILYVPSNITSLEKTYLVLECENTDNHNIYNLLSDEAVCIGQTVKYQNYYGNVNEYIVRDIRLVYEDQLPLPLNMMGKIIKEEKNGN